MCAPAAVRRRGPPPDQPLAPARAGRDRCAPPPSRRRDRSRIIAAIDRQARAVGRAWRPGRAGRGGAARGGCHARTSCPAAGLCASAPQQAIWAAEPCCVRGRSRRPSTGRERPSSAGRQTTDLGVALGCPAQDRRQRASGRWCRRVRRGRSRVSARPRHGETGDARAGPAAPGRRARAETAAHHPVAVAASAASPPPPPQKCGGR